MAAVARAYRGQRRFLLGLGAVLACMNTVFYLAIARLPLSTVGAIEFLGTIVLAALGTRTRRNLAALILAVSGVAALTDIRLFQQPLGFVFAFANCGLFMPSSSATGSPPPGRVARPVTCEDSR